MTACAVKQPGVHTDTENRQHNAVSQRDAGSAGAGKLEALEALLQRAQLFSDSIKQDIENEMASVHNKIANKAATEDVEAAAVAVGSKRKKGGSSGSKKSKGSSSSAAAPVAARTPTQILLPDIAGELREYQLKGVSWLAALHLNGMNGILADQMGLGKTLQTVSFLSRLRTHGILGPFLIVAPLATLSNWEREIARWCPSMSSVLYHGDKSERQEVAKKWFRREYSNKAPKNMPVIITTPGIVIRDIKELGRLTYKYLVVDEAHNLKNRDCQLVYKLKQLNTDNKLLLTGTPLQNNLDELWSLLHFIMPSIFDNVRSFDKWFNFSGETDASSGHLSADDLAQDAKSRIVGKLHEVLRPYLLRRVKEDVEKNIPAKQEIVLYAPLTDEQRKLQDSIIKRTIVSDMDKLASENGITRSTKQSLNNTLVQLRKNCNHPDILTASSEQATLFPPADTIVKQAGKFQLLERLLGRLKAGGNKVLIFSQSTRLLDLMDSYLEERGYNTRRIDGSTSRHERTQYMDEFNGDSDCFIMLLSTRAGGTGVNLMSADTVIIYDSDYNPQQDLQAMDRAHRIGQTRPVLVLRLCTSDSVEVKLLQRAASKLALANIVIRKGAFTGDDSSLSLSEKELRDVILGTARLEGHAQNETVSDDMLARLLDRTHLAAKVAPPYPTTGPGYELIAEQAGGLLSSVD